MLPTEWAYVDEEGRLVLPPEAAQQYGAGPGARLRLERRGNQIRLHRPVTHLTKVYVELTNRCNLDCRTCIRQVWEEELGMMQPETFAALLENLKQLPSPPTVFFGGLGEPMMHPRLVDWIKEVKAIGATAEVISNGTLLTARRSRQLIAADLDVLWISLDGATPESYADVRLGAELPRVLDNLKLFRKLRPGSHRPTPVIGIVFVAMRRNIHELPELLQLARRLGGKRFLVTNVMPHTQEMAAEMLYPNTLRSVTYMSSPWHAQLGLPRMDIEEETTDALFAALNSDYNITFAGNSLAGASDVCTFIEDGTISIGWDGGVAPCLPLLHTHVSILHGKPRHNRRHILGNIGEDALLDLWHEPEYVAYRERVHRFAFAPCTFCGGCEMSEANEEDCFGNGFPACGGCLWAQGVIRCP